MKLCLKSIDLFDELSIFLEQKLIDLINLFDLLDFLCLLRGVAALAYFLNYSCDFIIEVRLFELMSTISVAVWRMLLVDGSLREMVNGDIFLSWKEKIMVIH